MMEQPRLKTGFIQPYLLLLILVLGVASFFRFYQIGQLPPGLFPDEATHALDAQEILEGQLTLYSPDEGSTGALWRYLLALNFTLLGVSIFSLRLFASTVGVMSVVMAYLLVRQLPFTLPFSGSSPTLRAWWPEIIASLTASLLAVSYWHLDLSRIAFSAVLMLLIQDFTFFCLWRGLASGQKRWFLWFGFGLGLLIYNYLPGKIVFLVPLFFFLGEWLIARRESLLIKYRRPLLMAVALALLLALPLLLFALFNYQMLLDRAAVPAGGAVAAPSPWQGLAAALAVFGLWPTLWLSARWEAFFLGPLLTPCFILGVGLSLIQIRKPVFLFLLIWWLVMLLPGALAPEGTIPHVRRAIGVATPTFILVSLGLGASITLVFWLLRRLVSARKLEAVPLVLTFILGIYLVASTGVSTFHRYFIEWGPSEKAKLDFHVYDLELAEIMAEQAGAETVYLLPLDSSAGIVNPLLDTIKFVYHGPAAYDFLPDDEEIIPAHLSELTSDKRLVSLLKWKATKHTGADPKAVAAYYLEKWGRHLGTESYPYFDIEVYELFTTPTPFSPATLVPIEVDFEKQMALTGYAFGAEYQQGDSTIPPISDPANSITIPAGAFLWVELAWQKRGALPVDYQVGLWLEDEARHVVGRANKKLFNNLQHQGTSKWAGETQAQDYYLLPIDPATPPGRYRLKAVLYTSEETAEGGRRLAPALPGIEADLAVTLGEIRVESPALPPDPTTLPIPQPLGVELSEGLQLLGIDPGFTAPPLSGSRVTLSLWWQTTQPLSQDLAAIIGMEDEEYLWTLNEPQPLGGTNAPTSQWKSGTVMRTFVDLRLPADANTGAYNLRLRLLDMKTGAFLADHLLSQIQVEGRPHSFEAPPVGHKMAANFGDKIRLLGYSLDLSQVEAGGQVKLSLYWQALQEVEVPYKIFVHLLGAAGHIVTQVDREPQAGKAPTTSWLKNEVVTDIIEFPANENLAQVTSIALGLYHPSTGERLPVIESSGQVEETQIRISLAQ